MTKRRTQRRGSTLRQCVASIYQNISTRSERASVTGQIEEGAFELFHFSLPSQRGHPIRLVDTCWRRSHLGIEESRANDAHCFESIVSVV